MGNYAKLRRMKKADLIRLLIPLVETAVEINNEWITPEYKGRDILSDAAMAADRIEATKMISLVTRLRDLHDNF